MFAFNHWSALDAANRQLVLDELNWALSTSRLSVPALSAGVTDPSGRLALSLRLDVDRRLKDRRQQRPSLAR